MRGSIYFQTAQLAKLVFFEGAKKVQRTDQEHPAYQCIASYQTMDSYRRIWNSLGKYLREVWDIRDFEKIEDRHVNDYFEYKIADGISKQYAEKICSALGKLELALNRFRTIHSRDRDIYDFSVRNKVIAEAKKSSKIINQYKIRAYRNPHAIIEQLTPSHRLAAAIQCEGGARYKGIKSIRLRQLKGIVEDAVTAQPRGVIETKEKGGRVGDILVSVETYMSLRQLLKDGESLVISYADYERDIVNACHQTGASCNGTQRWPPNFGQQCNEIKSNYMIHAAFST